MFFKGTKSRKEVIIENGEKGEAGVRAKTLSDIFPHVRMQRIVIPLKDGWHKFWHSYHNKTHCQSDGFVGHISQMQEEYACCIPQIHTFIIFSTKMKIKNFQNNFGSFHAALQCCIQLSLQPDRPCTFSYRSGPSSRRLMPHLRLRERCGQGTERL